MYNDKNGDSKRDDGDFYGFVSGTNTSCDPYWVGFNLPILQLNRDSGEYFIEIDSDRMVSILETIHTVLERTPPQLVGDLDKNGIIMSGGGSLIYGIDRLIERSTGIRTVVVDDAVSCAAYGAGKMLMHLDSLQDDMMNFYRKRQLKG